MGWNDPMSVDPRDRTLVRQHLFLRPSACVREKHEEQRHEPRNSRYEYRCDVG